MQLGAAGSVATSDLRGLTRFLTDTTSTTFTDANIDGLLNKYYHQFVNEILKIDKNIDFNMVTEEINLVADQQTYTVTGKVLRIKRAEITFDGTNRYYLNSFDIGERAEPTDTTSIANDFNASTPFADWYLSDEALKVDIYPIPDSNVTNGLKVWKVLEITELSGVSDEPSIPEAYQEYLSKGASRDYFKKKELYTQVGEMEKDMAIILQQAREFYGNRETMDPMILKSSFVDYS